MSMLERQAGAVVRGIGTLTCMRHDGDNCGEESAGSESDARGTLGVDREVPVQVRVPASTDSASVTALGPVISGAIPYTDPTPSGG